MKAWIVAAALMAGGLALTAIVANALEAYAVAGHRADPGYAPEADAVTDRWGFPAVPKSGQPPKTPPGEEGPPASWHNQARAAD